MNKRINYISRLTVVGIVTSVFNSNPVLAEELVGNNKIANYKDCVVPEKAKNSVFNLLNSVVFDDGNYININDFTQNKGEDYGRTLTPKTYFKLTPTEVCRLLREREFAKTNSDVSLQHLRAENFINTTMYAVVVNSYTTIYVNLDTNQIFVQTYVYPYIDMFVEFKDGIKVLSLYKQTYPRGNGIGGVDKSNHTGWLPLDSNPWFTFKYSLKWSSDVYGPVWDEETNAPYIQNDDREYTTTMYAHNGVWADGWTKIADEWHYFDYLSHINHEIDIDDKIYYFDKNGVWRSGWINTNGPTWSYYYPEGGKAIDTYVDGYYLNEHGHWIRNPKAWLRNKHNN